MFTKNEKTQFYTNLQPKTCTQPFTFTEFSLRILQHQHTHRITFLLLNTHGSTIQRKNSWSKQCLFPFIHIFKCISKKKKVFKCFDVHLSVVELKFDSCHITKPQGYYVNTIVYSSIKLKRNALTSFVDLPLRGLIVFLSCYLMIMFYCLSTCPPGPGLF